jgi:uncharacterized protein (TIGR03083 family)
MTTDHDTISFLLAPYALDALDVDEALAVEAHLDACVECRITLGQLRETVDLLAMLPVAVPLPAARARTLAAALARRAAPPVRLAPAEVHLIESSRAVALLAELPPVDWQVAIGPALPDWTVQDLAAHLIASEALLADQLGVEAFTPEVEDQPAPRTYPTIERHRAWPPARTLAELETACTLVQRAVDALGAQVADRTVSWFGLDLALEHVLTQRAFEIWTHADDIRAAVGLALLPPPAPSLATMSATAVETMPILLAASGITAEGRTARIVLDGPGGATYDVYLGLEPAGGDDPGQAGHSPDVVLQLDVVDFCRGLADRLAPADTPYRTTGDAELAAAMVASLPALAVL